jgi:hypothetical protein
MIEWMAYSELAAVTGAALAGLPEDERAEWTSLWTDVEGFVRDL